MATNKPTCEMATTQHDEMYDELGKAYAICALAHWVKFCDGSSERRKNCPMWKGASEP